MRTLLAFLLLSSAALAQCYTDLDFLAANVRSGGIASDYEFSPRITIGYQCEDVGARARYWHLDTTDSDPDGRHFGFDVLDLDAYKQWDNIRAFGGLRVADVENDFRFSPIALSTTAFGPTAGIEGSAPIYGNVSANYGVRASILLADWHSSFTPEHLDSTLFVPEVYAGLAYRWEHAELGARFEIQQWNTDSLFSPPVNDMTVVGVGTTASVAW